jgi:hypothetical protein
MLTLLLKRAANRYFYLLKIFPQIERFMLSSKVEPSSRTTLMGEQPNPSNLLQIEDVMSRHRSIPYHIFW